MIRFWDYHCHKCKQTGSCPVPENTTALNAVSMVIQAHGLFNPDCDRAYQGRWLEIIGMAQYK